MHHSTMDRFGAGSVPPLALGALLAVAISFGAAGCQGPEPGGDEPPRDAPPGREDGSGEAPGDGEAGLRHVALRPLEDAVHTALSDPEAPDWEAVIAAAGALHAGAETIIDDRPERVTSDDRVQYEGLVVQLKERALDLQRAAQEPSLVRARLGAGRVTATCVNCHSLFADPAAPDPDASPPDTSGE